MLIPWGASLTNPSFSECIISITNIVSYAGAYLDKLIGSLSHKAAAVPPPETKEAAVIPQEEPEQPTLPAMS